MPEVVTWLDDGLQPVGLVGGKGHSLGVLRGLGLAVPDGFVVGADVYRRHLDRARRAEIDALLAPVRERGAAVDAASGQVRDLVLGTSLDPAAAAAIRDGYARLGERLGVADPVVAVRSSATAEDSAHHSFAGAHDSVLGVVGADAVVDAVRRCWASLFTARAVRYRLDAGAGDPGDDAMAVVVQRMVDARSAGVFVTVNPSNGDRSKVVVEAVRGPGAPLVGGLVTPDRFVVDKVTREILERVPAPGAPPSGLSLDDDEVLALVEVARRVEDHAGCPQDGEFVVDGDGIHLVQARPETTWTARPRRPVTPGPSDLLAHVLAALGTPSGGAP